MNGSKKKSVNRVSEIWQEQFISDHIFLYVTKGILRFYDGDNTSTFKTGEYFIARKNRLARYTKEKASDEFEYNAIYLDESFLKSFQTSLPIGDS